MRQISEIQAEIQAHHDRAKEKAVPVHFLTLVVLQNELNTALVAALSSVTSGISPEQQAFNDKVTEALFKDEAPAATTEAASTTTEPANTPAV